MSFISVQGLFADKRGTTVDIVTDALNQIVLAGPCFCRMYKCKRFYQHRATLARHAKRDFEEGTKELEEGSGVQLLNYPYFPSLCEEHRAKIPLYGGAPITVLHYVFLEMIKFVSHPCHIKVSVTEDFHCDKLYKLPKPNNACGSYEEAKNIIKEFLIPLQRYDVCPKDCIIFKGELKEDQQCPNCSSFRFTNGKPKKTLKYFPIGPRIGRLYQDENLIKILHAHRSRPEGGSIKDISETNCWKNDWFD